MPRERCPVCLRADRSAIEGALAAGRGFREVARDYSVPRSTLSRHWAQHLTSAAQAIASANGASANGAVPAAAPVAGAGESVAAAGRGEGAITISRRLPAAAVILVESDEDEDAAEEAIAEEISSPAASSAASSSSPSESSPAAERDQRAAAELARAQQQLQQATLRREELHADQVARERAVAAAAARRERAAAAASAAVERLEEAQAALQVATQPGAPVDELAAAREALSVAQEAAERAEEQLHEASAAYDSARLDAAAALPVVDGPSQVEQEIAQLQRRVRALERVAAAAHEAAGVERLQQLRADHEELLSRRAEAAQALDVAAQEVQDFYARGLATQLAPWPALAVRAASQALADRAALLSPSQPLTTAQDLVDALSWLLTTIERHAGEEVATIGGWGVLPLLDVLGREQAQRAWRSIFARGGRERAEWALQPLRQAAAETLQRDQRELERIAGERAWAPERADEEGNAP